MAVYAESEDLINVGAYRQGSNPVIDSAIAKHGLIEDFLVQSVEEPSTLEETLTAMSRITGISIPPEEMTDTNQKLFRASSKKIIVDMPEKAEKPVNTEDTKMALNSVAALFSSIPGMNILDGNN
jgi:hypothetical protein